MNDIALWIIRFVLAYMGMVPVCALIFWLVDILIVPRHLLEGKVIWWAAWRWPFCLPQLLLALFIRFVFGSRA